jgi:hypothetical protein
MVRGLSNLGDCVHIVPTNTSNSNDGVYVLPYCSGNGGWGVNNEAGSDSTFIGGDMENNTTGGWRTDGSLGSTYIAPYCEAGPGSSFVFTTNAIDNRVWFPLFGQCQAITPNPNGPRTNEIHYYGAGNEGTVNYETLAPSPGAPVPHLYTMLSGNINNGWWELTDLTTPQGILAYDPFNKILHVLGGVRLQIDSGPGFLTTGFSCSGGGPRTDPSCADPAAPRLEKISYVGSKPRPSGFSDHDGVLGSGGAATPAQYAKAATNCSSSASPAVCSAAPAGSIAIANAATTIQVNTTAVTANSQIFVQEDSSLGAKLGVTCDTTTGRTYTVSARNEGTSFTITASATPASNSACLSYFIMN